MYYKYQHCAIWTWRTIIIKVSKTKFKQNSVLSYLFGFPTMNIALQQFMKA